MKDDFRKPKWLLFNGAQSERETAEEMAGIAQAMQQVAIQVAFPAGTAMDNCGTGGDKSNSFNISTTSALFLQQRGFRLRNTGIEAFLVVLVVRMFVRN